LLSSCSITCLSSAPPLFIFSFYVSISVCRLHFLICSLFRYSPSLLKFSVYFYPIRCLYFYLFILSLAPSHFRYYFYLSVLVCCSHFLFFPFISLLPLFCRSFFCLLFSLCCLLKIISSLAFLPHFLDFSFYICFNLLSLFLILFPYFLKNSHFKNFLSTAIPLTVCICLPFFSVFVLSLFRFSYYICLLVCCHYFLIFCFNSLMPVGLSIFFLGLPSFCRLFKNMSSLSSTPSLFTFSFNVSFLPS